MDIGGRNSGTVSGSMNMLGNIGGALSPLAIGYILTYTNNNWTMTFYRLVGDLPARRRVLAVHRRADATHGRIGEFGNRVIG